jgi:hypothetical protein
MGILEDHIRNEKLAELEANFLEKKVAFTTNGKTYRITEENLIDMIGLVQLNEGASIGVLENEVLSLQPHTPAQLNTLLDEIRIYLTALKTNRFNKRESLKAEQDHETIQNFDTSF